MCKLVIRTADRVNEKDPVKDALCYKRDDVVCIVDDDHKFTDLDLRGYIPLTKEDYNKPPEHAVIELPGVPRSAVEYLLLEEAAELGKAAPRRRRAFKVDTSTVTPQGKLEDLVKDPRNEGKVVLAKQSLDAAAVLKPGATDPRIKQIGAMVRAAVRGG